MTSRQAHDEAGLDGVAAEACRRHTRGRRRHRGEDPAEPGLHPQLAGLQR